MKKSFFYLLSLFIAPTLMAGAVDWRVDFADDGAYKASWDNAMAYSYVITGDLSSSFSPIPSLTAEEFMTTWTPETGTSDGVYARDPFQLGTNDKWTGAVEGEFYTDNPDNPTWIGAAYLILVLVNDQNEIMYAYYDGTSIRNGLTVRSPTGASESQYLFDDNSNWTILGGEVNPDVPEPTALALLALGVAGVALRRRVV